MKANGQSDRPAATQEDRQKYMEAWSEMMVTIWREKIERLHVIDTFRLHQEIQEGVTAGTNDIAIIQHRFMEYGIYQDCGTGRGYERGNGGYLAQFDYEHGGTGVQRKPRECFSRPYFASVMVLKEQMAYMYGEEFCGLLVDKIEEANHKRSTSMRSRLWGRHKK